MCVCAVGSTSPMTVLTMCDFISTLFQYEKLIMLPKLLFNYIRMCILTGIEPGALYDWFDMLRSASLDRTNSNSPHNSGVHFIHPCQGCCLQCELPNIIELVVSSIEYLMHILLF